MIDKVPTRLGAAYYDGSGPEYITAKDGNEAVLALRWGCSCCKCDKPLTEAEVAFRDRVIRAYNLLMEKESL